MHHDALKANRGSRMLPQNKVARTQIAHGEMSYPTRDETHAMPKQPPVPIHIRIDTQEQRSDIPDLLAAMPQVHIEVIPLRAGDYDVGGDPRRVFERKTGSDFLGSLAQGRLFTQLAALRKSRCTPILLLEGDPLRVSHSEMRPESIR